MRRSRFSVSPPSLLVAAGLLAVAPGCDPVKLNADLQALIDRIWSEPG